MILKLKPNVKWKWKCVSELLTTFRRFNVIDRYIESDTVHKNDGLYLELKLSDYDIKRDMSKHIRVTLNPQKIY